MAQTPFLFSSPAICAAMHGAIFADALHVS
jgi:hypothetical protein